MVYAVRLLKFSTAAIAVVLLASCSPKQSGSSSIKIVLPSASSQKLSQSVGALSFDFARACFAVNVTGPLIQQSASSCSPAVGVFSGFRVPGSVVELKVPMGSERKIEVYLFNRASAGDSCPSDFSSLTPDQVALIGFKSGVELNELDPPPVNIDVTSPAVGVNLATQGVVANSCVAAATPTPSAGGSSGRVSYGNQLDTTTTGGYKAAVRVKHQQGLGQQTTTGGYKAEIGPPVVQ